MPRMDSPPAVATITRLEEALKLHAAGYWIVPCAGKQAVVAGWGQWRLSEDDLRDYLADGRLNIAIALHQTSPPLMDVEADTPEAEAEILRLCTADELKTPTYKAKRGLHRLFLRPPNLPERAKVEVCGIEFRIGNRAALSTVPPSVHPDGMRYQWMPGLSLWELPPVSLPNNLMQLCSGYTSSSTNSSDLESNDKIPEGVRNDSLFRLGCRLVRAGMGPAIVVEVIKAENLQRCLPPLPEPEVSGICKSVEEQRAGQVAREMGPLPCGSYKELRAAWEAAQYWTEPLDYVLRVALAVALSTEQVGDQQLFLMIVGEPGSSKSRLAHGLCVSKNCYPLEHLTGFHSGYNDGSGEDFSLLARINRKTWVTAEGDLLLSNPRFGEIMSQQRQIFDGSSRANYKNQSGQQTHEGLRTPWIICGTHVLLNADQSRLGDRFIRAVIAAPDEPARKQILRHVSRAAFADVKVRSNCKPESIIGETLRRAYQLTGGYVDRLRERSGEYLAGVDVDVDTVGLYLESLAEFTAMFRARPDTRIKDRDAEKHDGKELPTRLTYQFGRLAVCLAAVEGRRRVDAAVLRTVRQVALDTAMGRSCVLAKLLWERGPEGFTSDALEIEMAEKAERLKELLRFTTKIGITEKLSLNGRWHGGTPFVLSRRASELCQAVWGDSENRA